MRLLLALVLCSCSDRTELFSRSQGSGGCSQPIHLGDECAGAAAARRLRRALCSCSALVLEQGLFTEGGSGMRGPPPAAVGTNEELQVAGPVQVAGVIEAGGLYGAAFGHAAGVLGTLRSAGTLSSNQFLSIAGDAFVDGDVWGRMDIGGILHLPVNGFVSSSVSAAGVIYEPVEVPPPCDCGAPDSAVLIDKHVMVNDNAAIQLAPEALVQSQLDLPCGEYYLSQIKAPSELELRVHGRAALYIGGDVYLGSGLRVTLDPKAELDLVVGGELLLPLGVLGAANAAQVRLWLSGKTLQLGPYSVLAAAVYAPNTVVFGEGDVSVNGALLVGALSAPGDVRVHYDAEILHAGDSCGEMPQSAVE